MASQANISFEYGSEMEEDENGIGSVNSDSDDSLVMDTDTSEPDVPGRLVVSAKTLKKKRNVWSRDVNSNRRKQGKSYVGSQKGADGKRVKVNREARKIRSGCSEENRCRKSKSLRCGEFTEGIRTKIFKSFMKMSDTQRTTYVATSINIKSTPRTNSPAQRTYYLPLDSVNVPVCGKLFVDTLSIAKSSLSDMFRQNKDPTLKSVRTRPTDERDHNLNDFFASVPLMPGHYNRADSDKKYIQRDIETLNDLYVEYENREKAANRKPYQMTKFCEVFKEKNLSLYQPLRDRCGICLSNELDPDDDYADHRQEVEWHNAYLQKIKRGGKSGNSTVLQMDAEKNLILPKSDAKEAVFKLKVNLHNNSYINITTGDSMTYLFDETEANLKASTHCSTTIDFVQNQADKHPGPKTIYLLSDTCASANRNVYLSSALHELALQLNRDIVQVFYVKGHSFMEIDSIHSLIERKVKKPELFSVDQYAEQIKKARRDPIKVFRCEHAWFRDYSKTKFPSIRPKNFKVMDIKEIRYAKNGLITCRITFDPKVNWIPLYKAKSKEDFQITERPKSFLARLPIAKQKYDDVNSILRVIPEEHRDYYRNLPHS